MAAAPKRKLCLAVVEGTRRLAPSGEQSAAFFLALPRQVIPLIRGVLVRLATTPAHPGHVRGEEPAARIRKPKDPGWMR